MKLYRSISRLGCRICSFCMVILLLMGDASAVVKEVSVWGVRSINDEGESDNRVTMEQLEDDYSDFDQTDGLREYFHKEQEDPAKADMSEALSWLIDHEIICRDENIHVTGFDGTRIPITTISKMDVSTLNSKYVTRSDAIMYIYKAVFGPIDARTIGVETDNIRVDNGVRKTLYKMMEDHDYFNTVNSTPNSIVQSESTGGDQTVDASCITTDNGHYDRQTVTSQGGTAGEQKIGYAGNINSASTWRYTPQGDKYYSIFGDTNIFVSDINIAQQGSTGEGRLSQGVIDDNSNLGSSSTIESPSQDVIVENNNNNTTSQDNNHNAHQDEWAGTGGLNQGVAVESDYKQIYYVPAADLMFYRTNDVLELYIKAALSKGILDTDKDLRTELFEKTFLQDLNSQIADTWSPSVPAYVVNRSSNRLQTSANVKVTEIEKVLGKNFSIAYLNNTFNIHRTNLFASDTGYFTTERLYKMDIYRYIYSFISANEKKLSDLETEIVNYKYGMELDGIAKNDEDKRVIMYLIAKGILDFDSTEEISNLYQAVTYQEFLPVLYRVASANARLDFSKIQLTDSETSWRAKGYAPQSTYIVSGSTPRNVQFLVNPQLTVTRQDDSDLPNTEGQDSSQLVQYTASYDSDGQSVMDETDARLLLDMVTTESSRTGDKVMRRVGLGAFDIGTVEVQGNLNDLIVYGGYSLHPAGLLVTGGTNLNTSVTSIIEEYARLTEYIDISVLQNSHKLSSKGTDITNHRAQFVNNFWVISMMRSNNTLYQEALKAYDDAINKIKESFILSGVSINARAQARCESLEQMKAELTANVSTGKEGLTGPKEGSIKIEVRNPTSGGSNTWTSILQCPVTDVIGRANYCLNNITHIAYTITNSSGEDEPVELELSSSGVSARTSAEVLESGPAVTLLQRNIVSAANVDSNAELVGTTATIVQNEAATAVSSVAAQTGSQEIQAAAATGSKVTQYVSGKEGFLSWSQIAAFNSTKTNTAETIQIERISELLLVNKQTNTQAYFATGAGAQALVGTAVVRGDPTLGVAFKDGSGASEEYYYHIDAIRLLMNAKQESSVLSGLRGTALADEAVQNSLKVVNLQTESGHVESSLIGLKVQISKDDDADSKVANGGNRSGPYFKGTMREGKAPGTRWGRYISLSQSNRAVNTISRRITYQLPGQETTMIGYALIIFTPVNIENTGTAKVTKGMSMQDILDAAVKPPASEAGQKIYNDNMTLANAYANWIYGTTGQTYLQTGYVVPKAYFYYQQGSDPTTVPATVKGSLTDDQFNNISFVPYNSFAGNVCRIDESVVQDDGSIDPKYKANYSLSSDYQVMITGDRIYLAESSCTNLNYSGTTIDGVSTYTVVNGSSRPASFTLGSTFRLQMAERSNEQWVKNLRATVMETKSDGTIVCQFGPIIGTPLRFGNTSVVVDASSFIGENNESLSVWKSSYINSTSVNKLKAVEEVVIKNSPGLAFEGIYHTPMSYVSSDAHLVYTEPVLRVLKESARGGIERNVTIPNFLDSIYSGWDFTQIFDKVTQIVNDSTSVNQTQTWLKFSFSAYEFHVSSGILVTSDVSASDFLSPSLFTNLNDLIIDQMRNTSNGALPINEVPAGALLKVGNGYYQSMGTSDTREFVGYTHITDSTSGAFTPQLQDIAKSFTNHYIRGGAQYINVSHFFSGCYQLPSTERDLSTERQEALNKVATSTMSSDAKSKVCIFLNGTKTSIYDAGSGAESGAILYTPVSISFQDALLAYPSGTVGSTDSKVDVYSICADAVNSVAGPFDSLSFFTDTIMKDSLMDITTTTMTASWQAFPGSVSLMNAFQEQFGKAFRGDLFTLVRMIVFIILIWLVMTSWLCYGCYYGNLMPFIDAIKYPARDRSVRGIDLFKIISLGTISVDSDFKLGRFIQYNGILAILVLVVWKLGSINF